MKLTTEHRSEIISEMASSEAGFNELMRVLLDSFSKQERALFLEEHKGEYCCPVKVLHGKKIRLKLSCRISASFVTLLVAK